MAGTTAGLHPAGSNRRIPAGRAARWLLPVPLALPMTSLSAVPARRSHCTCLRSPSAGCQAGRNGQAHIILIARVTFKQIARRIKRERLHLQRRLCPCQPPELVIRIAARPTQIVARVPRELFFSTIRGGVAGDVFGRIAEEPFSGLVRIHDRYG